MACAPFTECHLQKLPQGKMKTAPSYFHRTKPNTPWYHLNSWRGAMRSLPCNGGDPFQPTAASAGSEGPLTGEVRREVLHRRLHQPRPLSASGQAYYPGHRFYDDYSLSYLIDLHLSIPFFRFSRNGKIFSKNRDRLPPVPVPVNSARRWSLAPSWGCRSNCR